MKKKQLTQKKSQIQSTSSRKKIKLTTEKKIEVKPIAKTSILEKGRDSLTKFLKKIQQEKPYIKPKKENLQHRQKLYTGGLQNVNTKQQTFATIEENKQDHDSRSIWAQQFEQRGLYFKNKKSKLSKEQMPNKNNKSCNQRFTSRKSFRNKNLFNSLESNSIKIEQFKPTPKKVSKKLNSKLKLKLPKDIKDIREIKTSRQTPKNKKQKTAKSMKDIKKKQQITIKSNHKQIHDHQKKFHTKKITEVSDQELQCSILRSKNLFNDKQNNLQKLTKPTLKFKHFLMLQQKKTKSQAIQCLKQKIIEKVEYNYPGLDSKQSKLLVSIILIQRLWRQKKVKNIIGKFLSPRNDSSIKLQQFKPQFKQYEKQVQKIIVEKAPEKLQKSLSISFNSEQKKKFEKKMLNFVQSFREVTLFCKTKSKQNFFNLTTSLSQKCLMEKFYKKLFSLETPGKSEELCVKKIKQKITVRKQVEKQIQMSQAIQNERFYTELKDQQLQKLQTKKQNELEKQKVKIQEELELEKCKLKNLEKGNLIINQLVNSLLQDFVKEFLPFSKQSKSNLKPKKKLPGLYINRQTINNYLEGLIQFIEENYKQQTINNLNKIIGVKPEILLKFLRVQNDENCIIDQQQSIQDEYSKGPVLPNQIYFQYEQIFQKDNFILKGDEMKYINFIKTILKIHNKSLIDCFVQILDQLRIFGVNGRPYPWQKQFRRNYKQIEDKDFNQKMIQAKNSVLLICQYGLGNLNKKSYFYQEVEQQNLLYVIKQQYHQQQKQWISYREQSLLIELQISNLILDFLLCQVINQINI